MPEPDPILTPVERCSPLLLMLASFRAAPDEDPERLAGFRGRLEERLDEIMKAAATDSRVHESMRRLLPVLVYGIDGAVVAALEDRADAWPKLEYIRLGTTEGGDRFFDLLENSREHQDPAIREVFLAFLQLGFRGRYAGRPERLAEHRERLAQATGHASGPPARFSPEAYERITACTPPDIAPVRSLRLVVAGVAVLLTILLTQYVLTVGILERLIVAAAPAANAT